MLQKKTDLISILAIIVFALAIWWPSRYLPYFWDSSGYLIHTALDFQNRTLPLLISQHTDFAHPPTFPGLLALAWSVFGQNRLVSHLLIFPFLPILLISSYFLHKQNLSHKYALFGTALVAFTPVVLSEYLNVYIDLPSAALATAAICLLVYRRWLLAVVIFTLSISIKLPLLTLSPIFFLLLPRNKKALLLIPGSFLVGWFGYHYSQTGWLLNRPGRLISWATNPAQLLNSALTYLIEFFITQSKFVWLIYLGSGLLLTKLKSAKLEFAPPLTALAILSGILLSSIFYVATAEILPRYLIYLLPLYAWFTSISLANIHKILKLHPLIELATFLAPILILTCLWRPPLTPATTYQFVPPSDLHSLDYIHSFRLATTYLELTAPEAEIYGGFPENQMLTEPIQGYVSTPLSFLNCQEFVLKPDILQIIFAHPYSPSQIPCNYILNHQATSPLTRFETNGIWVELYQLIATQSAATN